MITIIAGSQIATEEETLAGIEASGWADQITRVCCGMAVGADKFGSKWAKARGIPVDEFPPNWKRYGLPAGPIRNGQMAQVAEALILVWDGKSNGSASMLRTATRKKLMISEYIIIR